MSLKAFHIVFIAVSTLLAFAFAFWLWQNYSHTGRVIDLVSAILSLVAGVGLLCYGKYFLKKLKNIGYL